MGRQLCDPSPRIWQHFHSPSAHTAIHLCALLYLLQVREAIDAAPHTAAAALKLGLIDGALHRDQVLQWYCQNRSFESLQAQIWRYG